MDITTNHQLKILLLKEPNIIDCIICDRINIKNNKETLAYIVSTSEFSQEQLDNFNLKAKQINLGLPDQYVQISALPYDKDGLIHKELLEQIEVIDKTLVNELTSVIKNNSQFNHFLAGITIREIKPKYIHISELIPNWRNANSIKSNDEIPSIKKTLLSHRISSSKLQANSYGQEIVWPHDSPSNLQQALESSMKHNSSNGITYITNDEIETKQTYGELFELSRKILTGLKNLGLKAGDKIIFQFDSKHNFIPSFWACILGGIIPVPASIATSYEIENSNANKLLNIWHVLDKPYILTDDHLTIDVLSFFRKQDVGVNIQLISINDLRNNEVCIDCHDSKPDDLALLLLTSGSTGMPKMVMQSHRSILSRCAGTALKNKFHQNDISLNWFPLDHVGGLVMFHLRDVYLGCNQIQIPMDIIIQNPLKWLDLIEYYKATITWAPNFGYSLVCNKEDEINSKSWDLSSMRFLLNGGEAVIAKQARKFIDLLIPFGLSPTSMHPAWGMSETCSGVTYSDNFTLENTNDDDQYVEVGLPIPGFSMRIVDESNNIIEENNIGFLQVKGASVTSGYYLNVSANKESFTEDGWFITGDLGYIKNGNLTITGRHKDIIIINGLNISCQEVEAVVDEVENVNISYTAAIGIRESDANTDKLVIFFNAYNHTNELVRDTIQQIRSKLIEKMGVNPEHIIPVEKSLIPKTAIGKIQRNVLKQQYEEGMFDNILKLFDTHNILPEWFYTSVWKQKRLVRNPYTFTLNKANLIFLDKDGLGLELCKYFSKNNQLYIMVKADSKFQKIDNNHYCINPKLIDNYKQLFNEISFDNITIDNILHLLSYQADNYEFSNIIELEASQDNSSISILYLIQALHQIQKDRVKLKLLFITNNLHPVLQTDKVAYEKAPIVGILKTLNHEISWLKSRCIDLETKDNHLNIEHILAELETETKDQLVAYRECNRYINLLEKADLTTNQQEEPFNSNEIYLLSGGLGEIGIVVAEYLLRKYQAKLIIVGKTSLDNKNLKNHANNKLLTKQKAIERLEKIGGKILYEALDITNLEELESVIQNAEKLWGGKLKGVIHFAGILNNSPLIKLTRQEYIDSLKPKMFGAWVLSRILMKRGNGFLISFSSINGFFGGANFGAYSAANSFIDNFSNYLRNASSINSYSLAWSMWDNVGMSKNFNAKELTLEKGFHIMTTTQGLLSFQACMRHASNNIFIGINGGNKNILPSISGQTFNIQELSVLYSVNQTLKPKAANIERISLLDRFGTSIKCNLIEVDEETLDNQYTTSSEQRIIEKHTTKISSITKYQILKIWNEVLALAEIGDDENFFDLGGHSLLMIQVRDKLKNHLDIEVSMVDLFKHPTINLLSKFLLEKPQHNSSNLKAKINIIWQDILDLHAIGDDENFFDLGGHSLLMIQVRDKLKNHLGIEVSMVDLFKHPTINSLSKLLLEKPQHNSSNLKAKINIIWQDILDLHAIGDDENFFDLGGHSLLMIQVRDKLKNHLDIEVTMVELFKNPTLKLLSHHLAKKIGDDKENIIINESHNSLHARKSNITQQRLLRQKNIAHSEEEIM